MDVFVHPNQRKMEIKLGVMLIALYIVKGKYEEVGKDSYMMMYHHHIRTKKDVYHIRKEVKNMNTNNVQVKKRNIL